jgi:hypothetical protein
MAIVVLPALIAGAAGIGSIVYVFGESRRRVVDRLEARFGEPLGLPHSSSDEPLQSIALSSRGQP